MKVQEAADYLRISKITMYKMLESGRIKAQKAGSLWRITKSDLDKYMKGKK